MAGRRQQPQKSRRRFIPAVAIGATLTLLGGLAVFAEGYDAQEVLPLETSVWVARDSGQYARVNTDLAEIDTVRQVEEPTGIAQSGSKSVLFAQGYRQLWPVDPSNPVDLVSTTATAASAPDPEADTDAEAEGDGETPDDASGPQNTPLGTRQVVAAGAYLAYLTDTGSVFVSGFTAPDGGAPKAFPVNPFATVVPEEGEEPPSYTATAIAVSPDGRVASYSPDESAIRVFDTEKSEFVGGETAVPDAPGDDAKLELALVGDTWVLSSAADGLVWIDGVDAPVKTGLNAETVVQSSSGAGDAVYLADPESLVSIDLRSGKVDKRASASGTPAAPQIVDGVAYAAWISTDGGTLWSSESDDTVPLQGDGDTLAQVQSIVPVIRGNGSRAVLVEQTSGMIWTIPDGTLIPLGQWDVEEDEEQTGTIQVDDVPQQEPPVAVADSFGVRRGQLVSLPVLLNDHDPNKKDVLSVVPGSIGTLADSSFGDLGLVSNNQTAVIRVLAESGSTTFSYKVTDGSAESPPAQVTLTVVGDDTNTAPVWCGVDACQQDWPSPQVAPGGTVTVPVLAAWVDPEGDAIMLSDARKNDVNAPVSIVPTADGRVAIRHNDPNAPDTSIAITVTVTDSRGATAERELVLTVNSNPALVATPVVLVAGAGEKTSIDVADYVSGGSGAYRVVDAVETASTAEGLVVVPNVANGSIDVTAPTVGEYFVNYTVQDATTLAEQSALLRLTVVAAQAPLTIAPLTAIVRANEDTTVDVIGAVQNSTGRVLVVTGAASSTPSLSVGVVGQSRVRVSGSTADGEPGPIGTAAITVSDGDKAQVEGQVTVFLVPATTATNPIAMPDTVTVRAGAQVDIPVLDNDLTPRGERLLVHPKVEGSGTDGELVFAGDTEIRYLAPGAPGVYTLRYTTYLEGQPDRIDTAAITVTVLPGGANRPPQPPILTARAISGQTVEIPVDGYGMDPDGDNITLSDVEVPASGQGVSTISADGSSIVYTAPGAGVAGGQVAFAYTVRDAEGESANGIVRVGVVSDEQSDATPITYSDYVRAQRGSKTPVSVLPLIDDRDPAQGKLELISLVPNAPNTQDNPEYQRLLGLIEPETSLATGSVVLSPGDVVGTQSYVYTVRSSKSTSTAQGLIVVDVTDGVAPDMPLVLDTVLTAKDRSKLAKGIDVISGKVQWATGSVGKLDLSLWGGAPEGFTVSGSTIAGTAPDAGALIPFRLAGKDSSGDAVEAFGFLRIPAFDDMRVQTKPNVKPVKVNEDKSVEFNVREMLDLETSDRVEIKGETGFIVQRANATCAAASANKAVYKAGREAPWIDTCTVPVRLDGQTAWTSVAVPVEILPNDPRAILNPVTRTIPVGATESIDLYANTTTWEGGREGDKKQLDYAASYSGSSFVVVQSGTSVSIEARADARPGTRENITVSVTSFGGLSTTVTVVVGVAPLDAPRGATFTQQCDASKSATCAITVVGVAGEYDPFAGKPGSGLTVVKVGAGATMSCPVANVAISSATQILASWPGGARPAGGICIVPITVKDAQGRTGTGQVTVDVLSFPQPPTSITTIGFTGTSVTLSVPLGEAAQAHPSVTGVVVLEGGVAVPGASCGPGTPGSYVCTVSGLVNGERHLYTARTANSVGQSLDTTVLETWAYRAPVIAALTATSVFDPSRTSASTGAVDIAITAPDDSIAFRVINNNQVYPRSADITEIKLALPPGPHLIEVVPISQFQPPIGQANSDGVKAAANVTAVGSPSYANNGSASGTTSSITLNNAVFNANAAPSAVERYVAWRVTDGEPSCTMSNDRGTVNISGGFQGTGNTITVPTEDNYYIKACGTNGYGVAWSTRQFADTYPTPGAPTGRLTYTVSTTPASSGSVRKYDLAQAPAVDGKNKFDTLFTIGGTQTKDFALSVENAVNISVAYCRDRFGVGYRCDPPATVSAAGAPTIVEVNFPNQCRPLSEAGNTNPGWVSRAARASSTVTAAPIKTAEDGTMTVVYTVKFTGSYASLQPAVSDPVCINATG